MVMAATPESPNVGTRFCGKCGAAILAVPGPCPACGAVEWAPPPVAELAAKSERDEDVFRTRVGLLLLAVGVVMSLLPLAGIVGDGLILVSGIVLIRAGQPFGRSHRRNALLGLVLALGGAAGTLAVVFLFPLAIPPAPQHPSQYAAWARGLKDAFSASLLAAAFLGAVSALGLVLLTYSLQERRGRTFLWLAFALAIGLNLTLYLAVSQEFGALVDQAAAGNGINLGLLDAILSQTTEFTYLALIPNVLFAGCYFLADVRIRRGAIPGTVSEGSGR